MSAIRIAYEELEGICVRRGIQLSFDVTVWRPCHNHCRAHTG